MATLAKQSVLFSACLMVLASACATAAPPATTSSSGAPTAPAAPKVIEKLTYGISTLTPSIDPNVSVAGSVRKFDLYEALTWYDEKGVIKPLLATKWESSGPTAWTFTLRPDAKFHDGTPVTAKDVEFSWKRATAPGARSHVPGNMSTIDTITASGTGTVQVTTKAPDPLLPRRFFYLAILP